jgi:hypothetical protein
LEREIEAEVAVRYVDRSGSLHDDGWLPEQEARLLLAA